jgi:hypothetical protein
LGKAHSSYLQLSWYLWLAVQIGHYRSSWWLWRLWRHPADSFCCEFGWALFVVDGCVPFVVADDVGAVPNGLLGSKVWDCGCWVSFGKLQASG